MDTANDVPVKMSLGRVVWHWTTVPLCLFVGELTRWYSSLYGIMNYEDFYEPEDGPYGSWQSMDWSHRAGIVGVWLGTLVSVYALYRIYVAIRSTVALVQQRDRSS